MKDDINPHVKLLYLQMNVMTIDDDDDDNEKSQLRSRDDS